jgi:hypothetical protein
MSLKMREHTTSFANNSAKDVLSNRDMSKLQLSSARRSLEDDAGGHGASEVKARWIEVG